MREHQGRKRNDWLRSFSAGVTVGIEEMDEEQAKAFKETKEELERTRAELATAQEQVLTLQRRLNMHTNDTPRSSSSIKRPTG